MDIAKGHPALRNEILRRPRVDRLLEQCLDFPLTTVVAPPGYGKTISVASFLQDRNISCIWVGLSIFDNDPQAMWKKFATALEPVSPELSEKLCGISLPNTVESYQAMMADVGHLFKELGSMVVVFDDYNLITNEEVHTYLNRVINVNYTENYQWHYVIISNKRFDARRSPLRDAMLSVGEYKKITTSDLAFTAEETRQLFHSCGKDRGSYRIRKVLEKTDGWPFYLQMICANKKEEVIAEVTTELFDSQFFADFSIETQEMLLKLSLLPRFSLELLEELGVKDLPARIQALQENIFVELDHDNHIYRLQTPYRSFLQAKAVLVEQAEREHIQLIGGNWFFKQGYYRDAQDLYLTSKNWDGLMECLAYLINESFDAFATGTIRDALEQMLQEKALHDPRPEFYLGLAYLNNGQVLQAKESFEHVLSEYDPELDFRYEHIIGETHRALADVSIILNRCDGLEHIKAAADFLPRGSQMVSNAKAGVGENPVFFIPKDANTSISEVVEYMSEFSTYRNRIYNGFMYGFEYLFEAEAEFARGNIKRTETMAEQAISKAASMNQYDIALLGFALLIRCHMINGDYVKTKDTIERFETFYDESDPAMFSDLKDLVAASFYMKCANDQAIASWIKDADFAAYEEKPLWVGRNIVVSAMYALSKQDYARTISLLTLLDEVLYQKGFWRGRIISHIYRAIAYFGLDDKENALSEFWEVHQMAAPFDAYYPLAEMGALALPLIEYVQRSDAYPFDQTWVAQLKKRLEDYRLAAERFDEGLRKDRTQTKHSMTLSERELYALGLLSRGLTREEMADTMGISVNGVKKQLGSIYKKLGAHNRSEAVYIASMNNILTA